MLAFAFLFSLFSLAFSHPKRSEGSLTPFSRMLVLTKNVSLGVNPPVITPNLFAFLVLDANHDKQVASGLYTRAQADAQRNTTIAFIYAKFGIDFASGTIFPNGIISAGGWKMYPYAATNSTMVAFDSVNLGRGVSEDWNNSQYGEVLVAETSGVFPGGEHAGDSFVAGDVLTRAEYIMQRSRFPDLPGAREVITFQSEYTSKNIVSSTGYYDSLSKLDVIDNQGRKGFFWESIMFNEDFSTNITYMITEVLALWNY